MKKEVIIFIFLCIFFLSNIFLIKSQEVSTLATVEVKPIYELDINIEILDDKISSGENLSVLIELKKTDLISISEEISVDLNYEITKKGKKIEIIESGFLKTINIIYEETGLCGILISSNLKGKYILKIIASNPQSHSDEDSKTFVARKKIRFPTSFSFKNLINFLYLS